MAKKKTKKVSKAELQKRAIYKLLNKKERVVKKKPRYVPIRGDKARRYLDVKTGVTLSRRAAEKLQPRKKQTPQQRQAFYRRYQVYVRLRNDFIRNERSLGRTITKKEAMENETLKLIVKALNLKPSAKHSADDVARVKAQALFRLGRIKQDEIVKYVEKFYGDGVL